jgi:U3 small nucleolar RNA-associated protein 23
MRIKRSKSYKKHVKFYRTKFGFQEPFQVLVDGNFIQACSKVNFDVKAMLMRLLNGIVHINIRLISIYSP